MRKAAVLDFFGVAMRFGLALMVFGLLLSLIMALYLGGVLSTQPRSLLPNGNQMALLAGGMTILAGLKPALAGFGIFFTAWLSRVLIRRMRFEAE